jgi:hypothetical protein
MAYEFATYQKQGRIAMGENQAIVTKYIDDKEFQDTAFAGDGAADLRRNPGWHRGEGIVSWILWQS